MLGIKLLNQFSSEKPEYYIYLLKLKAKYSAMCLSVGVSYSC